MMKKIKNKIKNHGFNISIMVSEMVIACENKKQRSFLINIKQANGYMKISPNKTKAIVTYEIKESIEVCLLKFKV